MKVLVIGGAGYIGSHIVLELSKARIEPVIAANFSNSRKVLSEWKAEKTLDDVCKDAWRWQSNNPYGYSREDK